MTLLSFPKQCHNIHLYLIQFPLPRSMNNASRKNKNNLDTSSEMNASIAALPEDAASATASAAANGHSNGGGDNLCELEDSEDENTLGGNNGNKGNSVNPRVTSV